MDSETRLTERLEDLAFTRKARAEVWKRLDEVLAKIDASELGQMLIQAKIDLKGLKEAENEAVMHVRQAALTMHRSDQTLPGAVKIRQYTVLSYDLDVARVYAVQHLPSACRLDVRAFEKAAKAIDLGFVTTSKEPRVTIARDLSEFLPA